MNGAGNKFFSCSGFACDENIRITLSCLGNKIETCLYLGLFPIIPSSFKVAIGLRDALSSLIGERG
jgi:hypothetical protein